jgi:hypothetical protein
MTELKKLRALLSETRGSLARHQFSPDSPACILCGGESGLDVGRSCPYAFDYELLKRVEAALLEPVTAPVDWKQLDQRVQYTNLEGTNTTLRVGRDVFSQGGWSWDLTRYGSASSEEEAKAAAIQSARG